MRKNIINKLDKLCKKIDEDSWNKIIPDSVLEYFDRTEDTETVEVLGGMLEVDIRYIKSIKPKKINKFTNKISKAFTVKSEFEKMQTQEYNRIGLLSTLAAITLTLPLPHNYITIIPRLVIVGIIGKGLVTHLAYASGITKILKGMN